MKCYFIFALLIVVVLVATDVWNPFPDLWKWANRSGALAEPDVTWQQRLGGSPKSVTIAGDAVVIEHRTTVEARSLSTGVQLWERKADWAAVAGNTADPVVVVGKLLEKGYEVLDPRSGAVRRRDKSAVAVWSYRNGLLDARCREPNDCTITAWAPRGSSPLWTVDLPGVAVSFFADNPELRGARRLTAKKVAADAGDPEPMPALIGFPVDNRIYVVDTANGRLVQEVKPERQERIAVIGGRVLHVRALRRDGTCYFTVEAREAATGQRMWQQIGLNLRTADRAGCQQRHDPQGSQNVIVGVAPDLREVVVRAYDGRVLWSGEPDGRLLAVDDRYALARVRDEIQGYELGVKAPRWTRSLRPDSHAALARHVVVIVEEKPDRIVVLDPASGDELLHLRASATVMAVGPAGIIIVEGREIGYVRFAGPDGGSDSADPGGDRTGDGEGTGDRDRSSGSGDPDRACTGPKKEQCR